MIKRLLPLLAAIGVLCSCLITPISAAEHYVVDYPNLRYIAGLNLELDLPVQFQTTLGDVYPGDHAYDPVYVDMDIVVDDYDFSGRYIQYSSGYDAHASWGGFNLGSSSYTLNDQFMDVYFGQLSTFHIVYAVVVTSSTFSDPDEFKVDFRSESGPFVYSSSSEPDSPSLDKFWIRHDVYIDHVDILDDSESIFFLLHQYVNSSSTLFFASDLEPSIDVDLSFVDFSLSNFTLSIMPIDGYLGGYYTYYVPDITTPVYDNLWPTDDYIAPVTFPTGDLSVSTAAVFNSINSFSIVSVLIVGIGVLSLSFFAFRIIVWK